MSRPPFPHMMERDVPLFAAFILSGDADLYTQWIFDLHVGFGQMPEPWHTPAQIIQLLELTRLRIDAVGLDGGYPTVFEVKPVAGLAAFGQIVGYRWWYKELNSLEPRAAIICEEIHPDVATLCNAFNVAIHRVKPATVEGIFQACQIVQADCSQLIVLPDLANPDL